MILTRRITEFAFNSSFLNAAMGQTAEKPKPKRRWYQSGPCALVLLVAAVCLVVGGAIWYLRAVIAYKRVAYDMREMAEPAPVTKNPWWLGPFMTTEVDYSGRFTPLRKGELARVSRHLQALPNLKVLNLSGKDVDDDDLRHLKPLADLETLHLSSTQVSDDGLQHLQGLSNLRELYLDGTRVTDDGVTRLKQALPKCRIYR